LYLILEKRKKERTAAATNTHPASAVAQDKKKDTHTQR
jgi:hypothetical protein